jgi:hypothetical protein
MILNTSIRRKGIRVIFDSSAQENFILPETIKQLNVFIREKEELYLLNIIDRTVIKQDKGIVQHKIIPIRVIIGKHIEEISLDVVKINSY